MDYVIVEESETNRVRVFSVITIFVYAVLAILIAQLSLVIGISVFCIGLFLVGFSEAYKITKEFENYKLFFFFGKVIWKTRLTIEFPDYISVFHATFSTKDEEGNTDGTLKKWVLRFFTENRYFTVLEDETYDIVLNKANELSNLLGVDIYDTTTL